MSSPDGIHGLAQELRKIFLGETFHKQCVCYSTSADIPYHSKNSVSTEKKKHSQAERLAFSAG